VLRLAGQNLDYPVQSLLYIERRQDSQLFFKAAIGYICHEVGQLSSLSNLCLRYVQLKFSGNKR
jgi:hypothetical protein